MREKLHLFIILFLISTNFVIAKNTEEQGTLSLNGMGAKVVVPGASSTNLKSGSWGAFVKLDVLGNTYQRIIYKNGELELFYHGSEKKFEAEIVVNGRRYEVNTDSSVFTIVEGVWYSLFATYDGDVLKLYVDGNLVDTNDLPDGDIDNNLGDWGIGAAANNSSYSFNGQIDEVILLDTVVDENTIKEFKCNEFDNSSIYYDNIVAYYQFDNTGESETRDSRFGTVATFNSGANIISGGIINEKLQLIKEDNQLKSNIEGDEYRWYYNGNIIEGASDKIITIAEDGLYSLQLSRGNCTLSDEVNIGLTSLSNQINSNEIILYPNPSNGAFNINFASEVYNGKLTIYSVSGNVEYEMPIKNQKRIEVKDFKKGIYILKISNDKKVIYYQKLLVH